MIYRELTHVVSASFGLQIHLIILISYMVDWRVGTEKDGLYRGFWLCLACNDSTWREKKNIGRHIKTDRHMRAVNYFDATHDSDSPGNGRRLLQISLPANSSTPVLGPLGRVLRSLTNGKEHASLGTHSHTEPDCKIYDDVDHLTHDGNLDITLEASPEDVAVSRITSTLSSWLQDGPEIILNTYSDEEDLDEGDYDLEEYIPSIFFYLPDDSKLNLR